MYRTKIMLDNILKYILLYMLNKNAHIAALTGHQARAMLSSDWCVSSLLMLSKEAYENSAIMYMTLNRNISISLSSEMSYNQDIILSGEVKRIRV